MSEPSDLTKPVDNAPVDNKTDTAGIEDNAKNAEPTTALRFAGYWVKPVTNHIKTIKSNIAVSESKTKKLVVSGLLSAIAAIMQSAGALGGPGFAVSALVTLPISIAAIYTIYSGVMAYAATLCLLLFLQPSEIIVFPCTTGLLGLSIGLAFRFFKTRAAVIAFAALSLTIGIGILLYGLKFPVLGPSVCSQFHLASLAAIYTFSFFYSWLWVEVSMANFKFLSKALIRNVS